MVELADVAGMTALEPRVFVVEHQPFDYSAASVFGPVQFIEARRLPPSSPGKINARYESVLEAMRLGLKDYVPGVDYIVPTGSPAKLLLTGLILASLGKLHRVLGWDGHAQRYVEYSLHT